MGFNVAVAHLGVFAIIMFFVFSLVMIHDANVSNLQSMQDYHTNMFSGHRTQFEITAINCIVSNNIEIYSKNTGKETIRKTNDMDKECLDLYIDDEFIPHANFSITLLDTTCDPLLWNPGESIRIDLNRTLNVGLHIFKLVTCNGIVETSSFTFANWWNASWPYRKEINVTEPGVNGRLNWPVDVGISTNDHVVNCTAEFRVTNERRVLVPYKVYNETYFQGNCTSANVVFLVNESFEQTRKYHVYYGNFNATEEIYDIFNESCETNEDSNDCVTIHYSRYDIPSGLDTWDRSTNLNLWDDATTQRNLPWNFNYFNKTFNTAYVCSNGFLDFGNETTDSTPNQDEFLSNMRVAVAWDDLISDVYENEYTDRIIWTWNSSWI